MSKFHKSPNRYVTEIALKVEDLNRSLKFYKEVMGFKILLLEDRKAILTADEINPIVTIEQPEDIKPKEFRRTGLYHYALLLPNRKELGKFIKHLKEVDYPIIGASHHGVSEALYLEDVDDNGIEVYADTPYTTWQWKGNTVDMVTKPLYLKELMEKAKDEVWDEISKETIIGHIHLHVSSLEEAERFYVDGLGFNVVARMPGQATFTSTGNYHHHIAFNVWNGIGAPPPSKNSVGMKYFTVKFPDEKTRQDTIDNLIKLGYEVKFENGNHIAKDPSENEIHLII
mgnify:CR=1 FL=1